LSTSTDRARKPALDPLIEAVLDLLCEAFPKCFARYEVRRQPLKVGIHDDILARLDGAITEHELSRALRVYVSNKVYRGRLCAGAERIDLDGAPAGTVTSEHAARAVPASKTKPTAVKTAQPDNKRLSLADLRAAARQRKQLAT
jgi:sRNA-binding protein